MYQVGQRIIIKSMNATGTIESVRLHEFTVRIDHKQGGAGPFRSVYGKAWVQQNPNVIAGLDDATS